MQPNCQLGLKEQIKVFTAPVSGRILGFAPAHATPLVPRGTPYREETIYTAKAVERWVAKYRAQQEDDAERATFQKIQRESVFRKSLRDAILERNKHVSPVNVALNNVLIRLMEERYDKMLQAKMKPVVHGMNEASETPRSQDNQIEQLALASSAFREKDNPATGGTVSREIAKLEYDRTH